MVETIRIFVIGNTLFSETISELLFNSGSGWELICFPKLSDAKDLINKKPPDLLILAGTEDIILVGNTPFLPMCPDIPIICTDLKNNYFSLVTTNHIEAGLSELIHTVEGLTRKC